jgi:Ner family transcriptional regulator
MPKAKGWHLEQIKAQLRERYGSLAALSRSWGYNRAAISMALAGMNRSTRLERRIAEALQQQPHTLWPDRWTPDGAPLPRGRDTTRARPAPHRQIERAA